MRTQTQSRDTGGRDPIEWIIAHLELRDSGSVDFLYDHTESQSGEGLPIVYQAFDGRKRGHFVDRGQILDFAAVAGRERVLDFGPGDGWPSLLLAPMVREVVGVDGSQRRVDVCTNNAKRLGITNARFVHVPPREMLPFEDGFFDGVTAASSIEQTPDPKATLKELHRVLKPGGRLRMDWEGLQYYRGGRERDVWLMEADAGRAHLVIFDRRIDEELAQHYGLALEMSMADVRAACAKRNAGPSYATLTPETLEELCSRLIEAVTWTTVHPSCRTLRGWLTEVGFRSAALTHKGGWFAKQLFDRLDESQRPCELDAVDRLLRPIVDVVVELEAAPVPLPDGWNPKITAIK